LTSENVVEYHGVAPEEFLEEYCRHIQQLDPAIRFVGMADYSGKLIASYYRPGLKALMDRKETEQYALQTVFRARTRGGYKPQLGEQRYSIAVYEKLVRTTITIVHPKREQDNIYLLLSLDIGINYQNIIETTVIPSVLETTTSLLRMTLPITRKYTE
jgi:hypothetical protein